MGGALAGVVVGALTISLATVLGAASTGTAISALSGIALKNATLAWIGGGSLASGGLGVAGGTAILGGLVGGTALLAIGTVIGIEGNKSLEKAKMNALITDETCEQLENGTAQCVQIRRRTYMYYSLLSKLDTIFTSLIKGMEDTIATEGLDYSKYSKESKRKVSAAAATAVTIKSILDTPILNDDGELTTKSEDVYNEANDRVLRLQAK